MMADSGFPVLGVLLAGGQGRRMGYVDKGLMALGGRPLLEIAIERARGQVSDLILNAAGDPRRFAAFGLPVVADVIEGFAGPLAGILTGLEWAAAHRPEVAWVATFATDAPFLPGDLVARLAAATGDAHMACARSAGRTHPVFGLWPVGEREALRRALVDEDIRKVDRWTARYTVAHVDFRCDPVDPFFNVNTPEDLATAERLISAAP